MQDFLDTETILAGLVITIDGPAGSGKTTTARGVAAALGLVHVDTGAMYRAVTLRVLEEGIDASDAEAVARVAADTRVEFEPAQPDARVRIAGRDVTGEIRSPEVTRAVSAVSAVPAVRRVLVAAQRRHVRSGGVVLEGRDTGSVVAPWADVKVFLQAGLSERARRRQRELERAGASNVDTDAVAAELERRDRLDSERAVSPLVCPVGATVVDTSALTIEGQVGAVADLARECAVRLADLRERGRSGTAARRRPSYRAAQITIGGLARVLFGLRVHTPLDGGFDENYIFAPNHRSNIDPPVVGSTFLRESHYVAKAALFRGPLFSAIMRWCNAFPIRRGVFDREAMRHAEQLLRAGRSVTIFPEGGRVSGPEFGAARSGVGVLAIRTGVPVVPVYIGGSERLRSCVLGRHLVVAHGRPIRIAPGPLRVLQERGDRDDCRRYAEMVMEAMSALRDEVEQAAAPRR